MPKSAFAQFLKITGSTYQYDTLQGKLVIRVDQTKVIEMLPLAFEHGLYEGVGRNLLISHPTFLSEINALWVLRSVISYVYNTYPQSNKIQIKVYLRHPNIQGLEVENYLYSMDMTRDFMNDHDWDSVALLKLENIFPNFKSSEWRKLTLEEEIDSIKHNY